MVLLNLKPSPQECNFWNKKSFQFSKVASLLSFHPWVLKLQLASLFSQILDSYCANRTHSIIFVKLTLIYSYIVYTQIKCNYKLNFELLKQCSQLVMYYDYYAYISYIEAPLHNIIQLGCIYHVNMSFIFGTSHHHVPGNLPMHS